MGTVTIGTDTFEIYGTLAGATTYMNGLFGPNATKWRALVADDKARTLVMARDYLDRQSWMGTATLVGTSLDWPRSGVTNPDGTAVDSLTVPPEVTQAEYEMAVIIAADASAYAAPDSGSNVHHLKAGPLDISYFKPTLGNASKLPPILTDLVGKWLGGAVAVAGTVSGTTGAGSCSQFDNCDTYKRSSGF